MGTIQNIFKDAVVAVQAIQEARHHRKRYLWVAFWSTGREQNVEFTAKSSRLLKREVGDLLKGMVIANAIKESTGNTDILLSAHLISATQGLLSEYLVEKDQVVELDVRK
jgi:hypothetical protein